jgi:transposase InsO family protein
LAYLRRKHGDTQRWPSASTVHELFEYSGFVKHRGRSYRVPAYTSGLIDAQAPNEVWCTDFKGWFRTQDGTRCDPFTLTDMASRFCLACDIVPQANTIHVQNALERVFRAYGLPFVIRSDNGSPFAGRGLGGFSKLSVWLLKLGIHHERIEPGKPQQNGKHERFHKTLNAEAVHPPQTSLLKQQQVFDAFREDYNFERPHEGIQNRTPSDVYRASPRAFPRRLAGFEYDSDFEVRSVRTNGEIKWKGSFIFVGAVFTGERLGFKQVDENIWDIYCGDVKIGQLDSANLAICR